MRNYRIALTAAITMLSLATIHTSAQAQSPRHLDDVAFELRQQAQGLQAEFSTHFRHTQQYRHLMADSAEIARLADHIHDVAHHGGDPRHLADDVNQLDREFHHLEGLVANIQRQTGGGYSHGGYGHGGFGGHAHGDLRHVNAAMRQMENNLHHLQSDLTPRTQPGSIPRQVGPRGRVGQPVPRRGIQIRLPGFSFRFGR